jgi:hypothetical protein
MTERTTIHKTGTIVNHPDHYNVHPAGVECVDIVEHMTFNVGNAIKYLWRADHKKGLEDLRKAAWYVNREIERIQKLTARSGIEISLESIVNSPVDGLK